MLIDWPAVWCCLGWDPAKIGNRMGWRLVFLFLWKKFGWSTESRVLKGFRCLEMGCCLI